MKTVDLKKIVITGVESAGKTALIKRVIHGSFITTTPTASVNFDVVEHDSVLYALIDITGESRFRKSQSSTEHIQTADGIVFVVDGADVMNWVPSKTWLTKTIELVEDHVPIVFLVTKDDSREIEIEEIRNYFNFESFGERLAFFITSSASGQNVKDAFKWICDATHGVARASAPNRLKLTNVYMYMEDGTPLLSITIGNREEYEQRLFAFFTALNTFAADSIGQTDFQVHLTEDFLIATVKKGWIICSLILDPGEDILHAKDVGLLIIDKAYEVYTEKGQIESESMRIFIEGNLAQSRESFQSPVSKSANLTDELENVLARRGRID